jgi:choline transport protein
MKLAPKKYQRILSYACGFVLCFTWESYLTSGSWITGMNISAMITIWTGEYQTYYTFVPTVCILIFACAVNLTWGKHMNILESLVLVIQFVAFFLVLVILAMASAAGTLTASFNFETPSGWPQWVGGFIGLYYCTGVLGGFDTALHLAEDTEDPTREIPQSLLLSTTVNSVTCVIVSILITLCAGDPNLLTGPLAVSGHPLGSILQLFVDATRGNKSAACSVFALCSILFMVGCINTMTTASRMLFSLIRDGRDPIVTKLMANVSFLTFRERDFTAAIDAK